MENRKKRIVRRIIAILSCIAMLQTTALANAASVINGSSEAASVDKVTMGMSDASAADLTVDVAATGERKRMTIASSALSTYKLTNNGSSWVRVSTYQSSNGIDETGWGMSSSFYIIADENTSENERSQVITLIYKYYSRKINILVRQPGQAKPEPETKGSILKLENSSITVDANGTASPSWVYVDTQGTGGFTAKTDGSSWLQVGEYAWNTGSEVSFSNSGSFYVSVESNPTSEQRTGYITVLHADGVTQEQITVSQAGQEMPVLNVDVSNITVNAEGVGSVKKVNVDTEGSGGFTVKTDENGWVKLGKYSYSRNDSQLSFDNSGSFYVFFDSNSTAAERTQNITVLHADGVTERTIVVSQEKKESFLDVKPSNIIENGIIVNAKGRSSVDKVTVDTKKSGGFTVKTDGSNWIKLGRYSSYGSDSELSFEGSNSFYVSFESNTSVNKRTGSITIFHDDGIQKQISVTQDGMEVILAVTPTEATLDQAGSSYKDYISVNTGDTGSCTVEVQNASWLKVSRERESNVSMGLSKLTLSGKSGFYLLASQNKGEEERTATIKVTHELGGKEETVAVTQIGKEKLYLELEDSDGDDQGSGWDARIDFDDPAAATSDEVKVFSNTKWNVTVSSSWVSVKPGKGSGDGSFNISVKKNSSSKQREATITITSTEDKSLKRKILVSQPPREIPPKDLLKYLTVSVSKKTLEKGKTTKVKFSYPEGLYPSDIKSVTYSTTKKKVATVSNKGVVKGVAKGKATIKVTVKTEDGGSKTFKIKMTVDKRKITKK